jgi:cyclic pyranopterin phosphate synthase
MDLRTAMRNGASNEDIAAHFRKTVAGKLPGHGINDPKFIQPQRPMSAIGG